MLTGAAFGKEDYENQRQGYRDYFDGKPPARGTFWYLYGYFHSGPNFSSKVTNVSDATLAATLADPHTVPDVIRRNLL